MKTLHPVQPNMEVPLEGGGGRCSTQNKKTVTDTYLINKMCRNIVFCKTDIINQITRMKAYMTCASLERVKRDRYNVFVSTNLEKAAECNSEDRYSLHR